MADGSIPVRYQDKFISVEQAAQIIQPGDRIFVGTACATPRRLVAAGHVSDMIPSITPASKTDLPITACR